MRNITICILFIFISGCYSEKKARQQFGKAAAAYPTIPAEYCAQTFPPQKEFIRGKDSVIRVIDTILEDNAGVTYDTVISHDTVVITKTHQLPNKIITKTFVRTDTVYAENKAALQACNLALRASVQNEGVERKEADKWRKIALRRFWIIVGLGVGIVLWMFALVRRKVVKKAGL